MAILVKILPNKLIGICMGHIYLENWYRYGSTFKIPSGTSLLKPNLSTHGDHNSMSDAQIVVLLTVLYLIKKLTKKIASLILTLI